PAAADHGDAMFCRLHELLLGEEELEVKESGVKELGDRSRGTPDSWLLAPDSSRSLWRRPVVFAIDAAHEPSGVFVADDLLGARIELQSSAGAGGDVRQMDDPSGAQSDVDVGVQLLLLAADAVEEVLVMRRQIGRAGAFGQQLVARTIQFPADRVPHDQHSLLAIECRAVLIPFL